MDLLTKREQIVARHKAMEAVDESPWSPNNPVMAARLKAGEALLSERPVAFVCDDQVVVVGPCVAKVLDGLARYVADPRDNPANEPVKTHALKVAERSAPDADGYLVFGQRDWNGCVYALAHVGVQVVLSDGGGS